MAEIRIPHLLKRIFDMSWNFENEILKFQHSGIVKTFIFNRKGVWWINTSYFTQRPRGMAQHTGTWKANKILKTHDEHNIITNFYTTKQWLILSYIANVNFCFLNSSSKLYKFPVQHASSLILQKTDEGVEKSTFVFDSEFHDWN